MLLKPISILSFIAAANAIDLCTIPETNACIKEYGAAYDTNAYECVTDPSDDSDTICNAIQKITKKVCLHDCDSTANCSGNDPNSICKELDTTDVDCPKKKQCVCSDGFEKQDSTKPCQKIEINSNQPDKSAEETTQPPKLAVERTTEKTKETNAPETEDDKDKDGENSSMIVELSLATIIASYYLY